MEQRNAIVTGGLRGLGRAMALGLAREGHRVLAVGHIEADLAAIGREVAATPLADRVQALVADLRLAEECDRVVAAARARFGGVDILVNNAGLTFTYIDPARYRRPTMQRFFEVGDDIVENVIATNYLAADRLARRVAAGMVARGWGRIVNVTTKLDTMNRAGTHPYGALKAALEMATEVWSKEIGGSGLTVNIVNPGAGANTPGMAEEMREMSREGVRRASSSPTRWCRHCFTWSRLRPTRSTVGALTPISGTPRCRRPKPPAAPAAPPASKCTRPPIPRPLRPNEADKSPSVAQEFIRHSGGRFPGSTKLTGKSLVRAGFQAG